MWERPGLANPGRGDRSWNDQKLTLVPQKATFQVAMGRLGQTLNSSWSGCRLAAPGL